MFPASRLYSNLEKTQINLNRSMTLCLVFVNREPHLPISGDCGIISG